MNIIICETAPVSETSIDAHIRNSIVLENFLKNKGHNISLKGTESLKFDDRKNYYDVIIVSYASFYADFKNILNIINKNNNAKLFWITNEYDLMPNGSLYKIFKNKASVISNFEDFSRLNYFVNKYTINLNILLFNSESINEIIEKKYNICYYGTFRKNRVKYFLKYFDENIIVSTSNKNYKKFKYVGCTCKFTNKFTWIKGRETLKLFRYSLYIEDEETHDNFNNLANRFYEALMTNTVIFFDENCRETLVKSEINDYEEFIVNSKEELKEKTDEKKYKDYLIKQKKWVKIVEIEKLKTLEKFESILKGD